MKTSYLYGLLGYPVKHSLSPIMHNAAFEYLGIPAHYTLFELPPERLDSFLKGQGQVEDIYGNKYSAGEICGFNITIPHKVKAKEILESLPNQKDNPDFQQELYYYVQLSGAVNTVKRINGELRYWNTDVLGFLNSLKEDLHFHPKNKNVLVIGCGGAGRAVIAALSWHENLAKKIYIYDSCSQALDSAQRHFSRFTFLKDILVFISDFSALSEIVYQSDLLVNASPLGMKPEDKPPIELDWLVKNKKLCVFDLVYNRPTQLVVSAKKLALAATDGLGMLLHQGMVSFKLWTEKDPPRQIMEKALKEGMRDI